MGRVYLPAKAKLLVALTPHARTPPSAVTASVCPVPQATIEKGAPPNTPRPIKSPGNSVYTHRSCIRTLPTQHIHHTH